MCAAWAQAAVEGALSSLANLAEDCPEVRRAAGDAGAVELLVACLQSARNGEPALNETLIMCGAGESLRSWFVKGLGK